MSDKASPACAVMCPHLTLALVAVKRNQTWQDRLSEYLFCGRFISADWLARWADSDPELTSIDNSSLLCTHGKLLPNKSAGVHLLTISPSCLLQFSLVLLHSECHCQFSAPTQQAQEKAILLSCAFSQKLEQLLYPQ